MRIAFDSQIFTFQIYGGVSRYITRIASELINFQQEVKVFAPLHLNKHLVDLDSSTLSGARLPFKVPGTLPLLRHINLNLSKSRISDWSPDVVHETYYTSHSATPKNVPTVVTLHDMIHEKLPAYFNVNDRTSHTKEVTLNRADHIICVSENSRKDLLEFTSIDRKRTSVVHLGFEKLQATQNDSELLPPVSPTRPYILYVGLREGHKNFKFLLQSFAHSNLLRKELDIVAFGGNRFTHSEQQLMASLGLKKNQVRHCTGDDTILGRYYQQAAAFVYPSLYEGFGIPPLEAMAHDCPVISSCTSSMPEVIGRAAEFFDPKDPEQLICAIEAVVFSNSRRAELISAGGERLKHYSWEKCAAETLAVYRQLH